MVSVDDPDPQRALYNTNSTNMGGCLVFPEGPEAIVGKELGGEYYEKAAPVIERQVARAGYRMAVWLDHVAEKFASEQSKFPVPVLDDFPDMMDEL